MIYLSLRSIFKTNSKQLLGIAKKRKDLSLNSQIQLEILTPQTSQAKNCLKKLFMNIWESQIQSGINSLKISTLLNTLKHSGIRSIGLILTSTDPQRQQKTERISRKSSKRLSIYFLTRKFRKLYQKIRDPKISWTRSRNIICQLLKLYNKTDILALNLRIYSKYFIKHSNQ